MKTRARSRMAITRSSRSKAFRARSTPINSDEVVVLIAGPETLAGFTENLRGASPGDEKDFDVTYPEDYGQEKLSGKIIRFHVVVKGLRRKDLPEVNDDFAQDLGDFRTMDELKDALRKSIFAQREAEAQREAKDKIVDKLVDANDFPVPEKFVERQIENRVEQRLRSLSQQGVDPKSFNLDWEKIKEAQHDAAVREVKASLILGKSPRRKPSALPTKKSIAKCSALRSRIASRW